MHLRFSKALLVTVLAAAATLSAQEPKKCSSSAHECERQIREMMTGRRYLGLQVVDLKPGVVIKSVVADSPAEHAGFGEGDRIIGVNGHAMTMATVRDFKQILAQASSTGGRLFVIIQRRGALRKIDVRLEPYTSLQIDKIIAAHLTQYHSGAAGSEK
jgi:predicted metalloprotease with PDZ domain